MRDLGLEADQFFDRGGCFLPRGFIRADKKTASHPEYSGRGQHKHCPEYDLMRNEVQKRKPVLHGTEKDDDAQYCSAGHFYFHLAQFRGTRGLYRIGGGIFLLPPGLTTP